ncbi:MAG: sulfatase, partial [Akkermansiaceae bacterium]
MKLTLLFTALLALSAHAKPLNVVFILADDLGWKDLGCYGSSFYETPNLDGLAKSGMKFTRAYAACPVCSPTRSSILTGQYPARTKNTDFFGAPQPQQAKKSKRWNKRPVFPAKYIDQLDAKHTTLAEALKAKGYATFFAGKWHLGGKGSFPEDHGFDINKGGFHRGGPYGGKKYFSPYGNPKLEDGPDGEHLPDRLASETVKFITANKDKPFLAYLSFYSVHTPLIGRKDLVEKYKKKKQQLNNESPLFASEPPRKVRLVQEHAIYAAMVESMDQAVGKVLKSLKDNGLEENTLVIFFSDNGGLSTSEGSPTSNIPLRAGKGWLYEGGIREPMIARLPGKTKPNSTSDYPVTSTDFFPTILAAAGLDTLPKQHID